MLARRAGGADKERVRWGKQKGIDLSTPVVCHLTYSVSWRAILIHHLRSLKTGRKGGDGQAGREVIWLCSLSCMSAGGSNIRTGKRNRRQEEGEGGAQAGGGTTTILFTPAKNM